MRNDSRVLIIGAGIGGLVAALALRRFGIDVAVFEQAGELSEIGSGITLWTNAIKALQYLNAADSVCTPSSLIERGELRSWRGNVLVVTPVGKIGRQLGAPSVCLNRAALQRVLFEKLDPGIVHLNSACIKVEQKSQRVTAYFSNGRSEDGAVLIGADGLRSIVRASLFGAQPPRYLGHTCYRGIVATPVSILPLPRWTDWHVSRVAGGGARRRSAGRQQCAVSFAGTTVWSSNPVEPGRTAELPRPYRTVTQDLRSCFIAMNQAGRSPFAALNSKQVIVPRWTPRNSCRSGCRSRLLRFVH
jgi:2-polyprenyl-6-methoxyphenol hydroxylase-like FAD-dependent oxidoreductase